MRRWRNGVGGQQRPRKRSTQLSRTQRSSPPSQVCKQLRQLLHGQEGCQGLMGFDCGVPSFRCTRSTSFTNPVNPLIGKIPCAVLIEYKAGSILKQLTSHTDESIRSSATSSYGKLRGAWAAHKALSGKPR